MTVLPGTLFLIDTSALARLNDKTVRQIIEDQVDAGIAATCPTIELEVGYSAQSPQALALTREKRKELYVHLALDERAIKRALFVQQHLANKGLHRAAGALDLLTAAVAELHHAIVLHYDADFEHIASVTGQRHQWIVPRGSID